MHHLTSTSFYEMWSPRQFNEVENKVSEAVVECENDDDDDDDDYDCIHEFR